jgi:high-affinity nickel permease
VYVSPTLDGVEDLDRWLAGLGSGNALLLATVVAVLIGLRHATDPDHVAALVALLAGDQQAAPRRAARIGITWGLGHATSLVAFGTPIVVGARYLPAGPRRACTVAVGLLIVAFSIRLWLRRRRPAARRTRTPQAAYAVGLVHGMGGSAGIGVLLLASIASPVLAFAALVLFAGFAAVSMAGLSAGFAVAIGTRSPAALERATPALAAAGTLFGIWYAVTA